MLKNIFYIYNQLLELFQMQLDRFQNNGKINRHFWKGNLKKYARQGVNIITNE